MILQAKCLAIPVRRIYLGPVKAHDFAQEIRYDPVGFTFMGLKVVASKTPGIQIGR